MLSSSVIKNVDQASHYYSEQDNYYTREEGIEQSEWWGRGAKKLNLSGQIDAKQFTELLNGMLSKDEQLGKVVDGKIMHRPGWDLTFSAPKSVSILALIGGDKRILDAHRQAVSVALSHVERSCGQARIQTQEGVAFQNTNNILAALFHHDLSRAKDPQLHTHSVVMNMTERLDKKWRSLASKLGDYNENNQKEVNGFIERVRHNKRYFSKLYETELAFRIKELGYEITNETESGIFEIVGVSKEVIQFFSKRRTQIKNKLEEKGLSGGKAAAVATLDTRVAKEDVDREKLKEIWEKEIKQLGFDCQNIIETSKGNGLKHKEPLNDQNTLSAIKNAAKALSVFQSTFTLEEVVTVASEYAIRSNVNVGPLLSAAESLIDSGELLTLPNDRGKTVLMAKSTLEEEKRLFSQLENNKSSKLIVDTSDLKIYLEKNKRISHSNHEYLEKIFGNDRIVLIEGEIAQNTLVNPTIEIAKSAKLNVALISPSLAGGKQFANKIKSEPKSFWERIKSLFIDSTPKHYSVMQFLSGVNENRIPKQDLPDVLMVENAQLLSIHQKCQLFEWNKEHNTKLILLGNQKTLLSQQIGVSLSQLSERGIPTINIQPKEGTLVKDIEEGNIKAVVDKMLSKIVELGHEDDRSYAMVNHFTKLSDSDRKKSWLVSHAKKSVNNLNILTHQSLISQGKLGKTAIINALIPVYLQDGKGVLAQSYEKGQIVRFNDTYSTLKVNRGEYLRVVRHSKASNRVILQKDNGKHLIWQPDKIAGGTAGKVELFAEVAREFSVNEMVMINRSLKSKGIVKGERMFISAINQRNIKLKNNDGKTITLDLSKSYHRHIDYGYSSTLHAIAHEKPALMIAELPAKTLNTNQRRLYQVALQARETWIYTDNNKNLVAHLEKMTGDRLTSHGILSQSHELKKKLHSLYDILESQLSQQKNDSNMLTRKAVDAMEYAMYHLSEREAGFTHKQLMQTAMQHALGKVTPEALSKVAIAMENNGIVLRGNRNDGTLWTTLDAVKTEREIIALCNQDKGKLDPIASDALLQKHCDPTKLKPEQIAAVRAITQSKDRVMAVQGHPGTGKTTMFATVADVLIAKNIYDAEGYEILGLAPTHTAVKELTERGIPSQTLDSFIISAKRELEDTKQLFKRDKLILVIDEASMVSNRKMVEVLKIAHQLECRGAIPTGDTRQLPSIESGKPFELVQTQVNTQSLIDIRRQHNDAHALKQAIKETISYDFRAAFQTLKDSIIEVPISSKKDQQSKEEIRIANRQERVRLLVKDYFSFSKEERENIQIITPGHDDRKITNMMIREQLKEEGTFAKDKDHSFSILTSKSLTQVERLHITNLKAGDVLRFGKRESTYIKSGDYLTIVDFNKNHNLLTLQGGNGRKITWQIPTFNKNRLNNIEVFQKESRDLQIGDVIRWSRSNKKDELLSTEAARVTALEKNKVTVELANKKSFTFDPHDNQFQHWDHGYAATVYAVQGKTKNIILAHLESFRENLTNQPSFLVALTRAVNVFRLYTDDTDRLLKTIEKNAGIKLSSLEVIGEFPEKAKQNIQEKNLQTTLADVASADSKSKKVKENSYPYDRYTISQIKDALNKEAERIAINILGTPKEKGSNYIKFGSNKGSLTITIKGEKQGWFNDFETNKGGRDMLKFLQLHGGMDKHEALQYGANRLGILSDKVSKHPKLDPQNTINKPYKSDEKTPPAFSDYEKRRIKLANKIAKESSPLKGSLAEKYLKDYRGIDLDLLPEDIRFHPNIYSAKNRKSLPALVAIARNREDKVQAIEAIYLDPRTGNKASVPLSKQTIGPKKGAAVMINQSDNRNAPTLIAEGVVTGLSLAKSLPRVNVSITLGKQMFSKIDPAMLSSKTIFCLDNDGKNLKADRTILEAANRLIANKKEVGFMVPSGLDLKKQDYNDILKKEGSAAIQKDFINAYSYQDFYKNLDPLSSNKLARMAQLSKESNQSDKARLNTYKSMMNNNQQSIPNKIMTRIRDIDREI